MAIWDNKGVRSGGCITWIVIPIGIILIGLGIIVLDYLPFILVGFLAFALIGSFIQKIFFKRKYYDDTVKEYKKIFRVKIILTLDFFDFCKEYRKIYGLSEEDFNVTKTVAFDEYIEYQINTGIITYQEMEAMLKKFKSINL